MPVGVSYTRMNGLRWITWGFALWLSLGVAKGQGPQPTVYGPSTLARAAAVEETVARQWNEVLLEAIRGDFARPTVHARNLFHSSVLAFDAFAAFASFD